jgi:hypothetical protein
VKVRQHVKPGNAKSLWDAVKIARGEDALPIASTILLDNYEVKAEQVAEAFALQHFKRKVKGKIEKTQKNGEVYN